MSLVFDAHFERTEAVETVTMSEAENGSWRLGGYLVRANCPASGPVSASALRSPPGALALEPFYAKYVDADGIPIVSSGHASDRALLAACQIVRRMLRKRPDLRERLIAAGVRVAVMAPTEQTLDLPNRPSWPRRRPTRPGSTGTSEREVSAELLPSRWRAAAKRTSSAIRATATTARMS